MPGRCLPQLERMHTVRAQTARINPILSQCAYLMNILPIRSARRLQEILNVGEAVAIAPGAFLEKWHGTAASSKVLPAEFLPLTAVPDGAKRGIGEMAH